MGELLAFVSYLILGMSALRVVSILAAWYQLRASTGFALSSIERVVESRVVRAARPFWETRTMGVP